VLAPRNSPVFIVATIITRRKLNEEQRAAADALMDQYNVRAWRFRRHAAGSRRGGSDARRGASGMSELAVHPVAALFPMLADDELEELAADIKANGLRFPIIRDKAGKTLIDGRNRLVACEIAGVKPDFITYAV
jgi:hypothetical protein